ncbi:MAG: hypothetical protein QG670_199 [Thermoproteota archaeon]|nr:hypothetical protein [Thermoproteota archaeon]
MSWPSATDYQEVIQSPSLCFSDPELRTGNTTLDGMGLPKPVSGAFAIVYQLNCAGHKYAVRCFLQYNPDREHHYKVITEYLKKANLPYMVDFEFLDQGIKVRGKWYPILKMEWIEGDLLNIYIQRNLNDPRVIDKLAEKFLHLIMDLSKNTIAHGDLHPANVIVQNGSLKLIDYDGMFVPGLEGPSHELGHRNFQHPNRNNNDFGSYLDNFSAWVIYVSLVALSISPDLWQRIGCCDDFLLFRKEDFENPEASFIFSNLRDINNQRLTTLIELFESCIYNSNLTEIQPIINSASDLLSTSTEIISEEVPSQVIGASWVWDHVKNQPFHLEVNTRFEKISLALFCVSTTLLLYAINMGIPLTLATLILGAGSFVLIGVFLRRFRVLPSALEKWRIDSNISNLVNQQKQEEKTITELNKEIVRLNQEENREATRISEKQNENARREKSEIDAVDLELNKFLAYNNTQRQSVNQTEAKEVNDQLSILQNNYLYQNLSKHSVQYSNIQGIGSVFKDRLVQNGIRTAVDFTGIKISSWGDTEEALIVKRTGSSVHVEGIGPKRAQELESWRQSLEARYRQQMPRVLPPDRVSSIRAKYQPKYQSLNAVEADAKLKSKEKKETVFARYSSIHRELLKEMHNTRLKFTQYRNDNVKKVANTKNALSKNMWEIAQKRQEFGLYREITFKAYLKKIFTS